MYFQPAAQRVILFCFVVFQGHGMFLCFGCQEAASHLKQNMIGPGKIGLGNAICLPLLRNLIRWIPLVSNNLMTKLFIYSVATSWIITEPTVGQICHSIGSAKGQQLTSWRDKFPLKWIRSGTWLLTEMNLLSTRKLVRFYPV
jgi:hypothetical protein